MSKISDVASSQKEMDDVAFLFKEVTGTELGYATFFWSLAYVDCNQDSQPSHQEALDKLMGRVHPGAIVLLHSTSKTNGEILDEVLTKWEEMGYTFRPLSDFTGGSQNPGDNERNSGNRAGRILQDGNVKVNSGQK